LLKTILLFTFIIFTQLNGQSLEKVSLQFHWKDQFEFAGYYMAKEKGFYKELGLDVEFKNYEYGINVTKEVENKKATYAIGGSDLIVDISNGAKISMLAAVFQSSPLVLLTTTKSNIKSIDDFKNKKVMLTPDTLNSVTYNAMLNKENISFADIHIQEHSFDVNDLIIGKTDLMQSYITNEPYALKKAGITPIIFDPKDYGFDFYSDILFTSEDEIKNHRQRAIDFKEASLKGWKYAFENIEESISVIHKKYNSQNRSIEALRYEAKESKKLAFYGEKNIGNISLHKLNRMYDAYNILNLVNTPIDMKKYFVKTEYEWEILLTQEEKEYLKKYPIFIVSNEKDYPPYDFFEDSVPKGYSIDLLKLLASKLNINIKFETDTWNNLVKKFCNGKIDILHPTDKSKQVIECGEFTKPIIQDSSQFLLRDDFKKVNTLKDLYGYKIASPKGWQQTELFKKEYKDKLKVIEVKNTLEAIEYVRAGKADFAFDYGNVLNYLKTKHGFNGLKVEGSFINGSDLDNLYIAVNKGNTTFKNILQKTINTISTDEITKLQTKWFGKHITNKVLNLSKEEIAYLQNNQIKMCVDPDWEPYEKIDKDGNHVGIVADFLKLIEKRINTKFTLVKTKSWDESLEYKKSGKCDILSFLNKTPKRSEFLNFTEVLYKEPEVIVAKNDITYINGFEDLKNKKVGIVKGYQLEEFLLKNYPDIKIVYVKNKEEGIKKVSNKEVFASIHALLGGAYIIRKNNLLDIKIAGETKRTNEYRIGVDKNNSILLGILDKAVKSITDQEKNNMVSQWISVKFEQQIDYSIIWQIVVFSLFIAFFLIYRLNTMKINKKKLQILIKEEVEKSRKKDNLIFQQNKLISMGEMIGNIAHQWRQPLNSINNSVALIDKKNRNNISIDEDLDDIENTVQYMSKTIDDFLNFYKQDKEKVYFDIRDVVLRTINIIKGSYGKNKILIENDTKSFQLYNFPNELQQVLLSILNNARDAIIKSEKSNGIVKIKTVLDKNNNKLLLEIFNNGGNIEEEIVDKIFEPYFTTKHKSQGTGLGLYIAKTIIEQSIYGKLTLENRDDGVCFIIKLDIGDINAR